MKPFGKMRVSEQPLNEGAQRQLDASVELANLFAHYIKAESLEEALAEMKALVEETDAVQEPESTEGMAAQEVQEPSYAQGAPSAQEPVSRAGEQLAQAYQMLEGSMDEEKLDMLMENEEFAALIHAGIPPMMAARYVLMDELLAAAEARGEKRGRTQVKNKLGRMNEVGTGMTNAFRTGIDPDKLSLKEIRDLKKRAGRGETITI